MIRSCIHTIHTNFSRGFLHLRRKCFFFLQAHAFFLETQQGSGVFLLLLLHSGSKLTAQNHTSDVVHHMYYIVYRHWQRICVIGKMPPVRELMPRTGLYLFVWMGAIVAEHQVRPPAVKQQVSRLEGQGEALDSLTEVKGVPQVVVGRVHKEILRNKEEHK